MIQPVPPWVLPDRGKVAMAALIVAESAIFTIFVVAYLFYAGKSLTGPTPNEVLETPVFYSICLLSSSITVHLAARFLEQRKQRGFLSWWFLTFVLGGLFLFGTGQEWQRLIYEKGLTISTNLFGTTYYSLVGLHAFHLTAGLVMLLIVLICGLAGLVDQDQSSRIGVLSLYWHFVDTVWVVVFTVVYILGR
jgi:cytochrome c oxidase subunit 3/cytochrome o ubiquinol oxidase subunit 3